MNQRTVRRIKAKHTQQVMVKGEWRKVAPDRTVVQREKREHARRNDPANRSAPYQPTRYGHLTWQERKAMRERKAAARSAERSGAGE